MVLREVTGALIAPSQTIAAHQITANALVHIGILMLLEVQQ
jgi:hypothetical protein